MGEDDESEALTYLTKLEENPEAEADFELLGTYAKSDSELVRYQTAAALVFPFTPRGEEILIALVKDRKWLIRAEACDALSSSRPIIFRSFAARHSFENRRKPAGSRILF